MEKGLKLRIAQNKPSPKEPNLDTEDLEKTVGAEWVVLYIFRIHDKLTAVNFLLLLIFIYGNVFCYCILGEKTIYV